MQDSQQNTSLMVQAEAAQAELAGDSFNRSQCAIETRMAELQADHMISQRYFFPFPYLCQIYHLLNLKHLENVHGLSLNNLEILRVSDFQSTEAGGIIKFQTILRSPINLLRLWRQPIVEVVLVLLDRYTVELRIPIYSGKQIIVLFNVIPLQNRGHQLFIDIYTNLARFKPILKLFLHLASCLTVFEDIPYIRKLASKNLERLIKLNKVSEHETMQLFKRFTELYGSGI
jgi:hypothetical protein